MQFVSRERLGPPNMAQGRRHTGRWSFALTAVTAFAVLVTPETRAQRPDQPRITVPPTIVAEPASQVQLSIKISSHEALPSNSFVRLRGLPTTVSLTEGYAIAPGAWAIPLVGVPTLKANIPAGVAGRGEIIITLVAVDGTVIAEAKTALVVASAAMLPSIGTVAPEPVPSRSGPSAGSANRPTQLSVEVKARAERLLARGEEYFASGNVVAARDFFERAADAGLAAAALRLATTYDPAELRRLQLRGVIPDPALARKWYERAQELGAPEAGDRLAKLGGN
jgi:hypothetical protein